MKRNQTGGRAGALALRGAAARDSANAAMRVGLPRTATRVMPDIANVGGRMGGWARTRAVASVGPLRPRRRTGRSAFTEARRRASGVVTAARGRSERGVRPGALGVGMGFGAGLGIGVLVGAVTRTRRADGPAGPLAGALTEQQAGASAMRGPAGAAGDTSPGRVRQARQ